MAPKCKASFKNFPVCLPDYKTWFNPKTHGPIMENLQFGQVFSMISCHVKAQYIYQDNNLLASHIQLFLYFLPGWSGAEIKCSVHYGNAGCGVLWLGVHNSIDVSVKVKVLKGFFDIFLNVMMAKVIRCDKKAPSIVVISY